MSDAYDIIFLVWIMKKLSVLFFAGILTLLAIGCGSQSATTVADTNTLDMNNPDTAFAAVSKASFELKDIFTLVSSGTRPQASTKPRFNFYPGPDVTSTSAGILSISGTTTKQAYDALGAGTYTYTNAAGDSCQLTLGALNGSIFSVTLVTRPVSNILVDYSSETVNVLYGENGWDPINASGAIDFTARTPYFTQYFDGFREDLVVSEVGKGIFNDLNTNLSLYATASQYASWNTADSSDYYSMSTATYAKNGSSYGVGQIFYCEDKDASGSLIKSYTKGYSTKYLSGNSGKREVNSSFSNFDAGTKTTTTYSYLSAGQEKTQWELTKHEEQYAGFSVLSYDGSNALTYNSKYITYDAQGKGAYGYKMSSLSGTAASVTGSITAYSQKDKPAHASYNGIPISDFSGVNMTQFDLNAATLATLFSKAPTVWNVTSTVSGVNQHKARFAPSANTYTLSSNNFQVLYGENGVEELVADASYNNDTRTFSLTLKNLAGVTLVSLSSATVSSGMMTGVATLNGNTYEITLSTSGTGGTYRLQGSTATATAF